MFAYCKNNPVLYSDTSGHWPQIIKKIVSYIDKHIIQPIKKLFTSPKQSNIVLASSHDENRRPNTGEPGSTFTAPNGDTRTYGPDGKPARDYDHSDHGFPNDHPHDENGGHNHDWNNGVRGPAYSINWTPVAGVIIVICCTTAFVIIAVNDCTGVGFADDLLLGPLEEGIRNGIRLIVG